MFEEAIKKLPDHVITCHLSNKKEEEVEVLISQQDDGFFLQIGWDYEKVLPTIDAIEWKLAKRFPGYEYADWGAFR
jgi:hypothetical protein